MKKLIVSTFAGAAAGAAGALFARNKVKEQLKKPSVRRKLSDLADGAIEGVLDTAAKVPGEKLTDIADYEDRAFMPGRERDCICPLPESAKWSLGYAQAGIIPDDLTERAYYLGGYLAYPPNRAEGVIDDLRVRTIAVDDGSGRGTVVFSEIDCVGISSRDVADIRLTLKKFALENNVVSINVGAIHCHSGIDTQGLWGD
ncbi:MAG: hypothetical protein K6C36_02940, partial [Clostridia bacterium]|nr:hypothetical protein [Clostridia bacterium]